MRDTGIETRNHLPQSNCGFIAPKAIRFCGDEMGDERPPMFALRAIPNTSAGPKGALCGRVRRMGRTREKQSVGAATFEIHIEEKHETSIMLRRTRVGDPPPPPPLLPLARPLCPPPPPPEVYDNTRVIRILSIAVLESAEEMVNPPMRSIMVELKTTLNTHLVDSLGSKTGPSLSSPRSCRTA